MRIQESAEDYLERILMLKEKQGMVRSVDIARALGYSKPSVSVAMKQLRENGYISVDGDGFIELTNQGMEVASSVFERHRVIARMLMGLGVSEETARADACRLEHDLSEETFACIKAHLSDMGLL